LQPIFCDVNLNNFSFDLKHAKKIASKHKDIKIVFTTHLLGFVAPSIKDIFPNAIFIDDVCESHGAKMSNNKKVGSESLGATFSFYFGHHMTTIEGGMISTNNFDLYNLMRMKRSHGMARESKTLEKFSEMYPKIDKHFLFPTDGYNLKSTELNAILGISQLKKLDANIISRKKNYSKFYSILCDYQDFFYLPENNENNSSFCLPIMCKSKDITNKLKQLFKDNFIEYRPVVCGNLLEQPFLKNRGYTLEPNSINNIDIIHYQSIYIGNNQFIADKNFKILKKIFNQL
jgi:CDP-6-deoxy-D-xylo-4-hexulose-3-dehydrase